MGIEKIFVAGAGLMGGGITQVCAQAGYDVVMMDIKDEAIDRGLDAIKWSLNKLAEKGRIKNHVNEIMSHIKTTTNLEDAEDADFVFEAIVENLEIKKVFFSNLDEICPTHTIFASNTSAIPVTEMAVATKRSPQFVGTHFFSPVPMMKIVEIVRGIKTSEETANIADSLCRSLGKETIRVNKDVAGFALNRINFPSIIEAINLVERGVVSVEDVDKGMRLGFGRPMGIFETSDMAGLDVGFNAYSAVYKETQNEKFYPPMLLQRKIKIGHLGRKTGIGWYKYDKDGRKIGPADE